MTTCAACGREFEPEAIEHCHGCGVALCFACMQSQIVDGAAIDLDDVYCPKCEAAWQAGYFKIVHSLQAAIGAAPEAL
jgi:hypothetical protein